MVRNRWNGGHSVQQLRDEMDRLFTGFFPNAARAVNTAQGRAFPAVNVWESGDDVFAEAEVPGLKAEQIEISVVGKELTIQGARPEVEGQAEAFHRRERGAGAFTRVIPLPVEIDGDKVTAKLEDGVLLVTLPKAAAAKPRKIQVNVI